MKNFRLLFTLFALFVGATTFSQNNDEISKTDTLFCEKYLLQEVNSLGIATFIIAHPDVKKYAEDHLGYMPEIDEESDLIVILKDHIVSVKRKKNIAETKKDIKRITKETINIAKDVLDNSKKKK